MPTQTGSIDFTSTGGFKSYATNKYATQSTVSDMQTAISQNAQNIALRATKTEASLMAQPNLTPYFSADPADVYNSTTNPHGYWHVALDAASGNWTQLEDGWARLSKDNSSGSSTTYGNVCTEQISTLKPDTDYTLMVEARNVTISGTVYLKGIAVRSGTGQFAATQTDTLTTTSSAVFYQHGKTVANLAGCKESTSGYIQITPGASITGDFRFSLYESAVIDTDGSQTIVPYGGPYKPYVGSLLYASQAELKVQSDRIGMVVSNADASSSLQLTSDAMEYIGDHVEIKGTDGTSTVISGGRIQANSLTIGAFDSSTQGDILNDNVQVGGRNLLRHTGSPVASDLVLTRASVANGVITVTPTTSNAYAKFKVDYLDFDDYGEGEYTVSFDAKAVSGATYTQLKGPMFYAAFNPLSRLGNSLSSSYDRYVAFTLSETLTYEWVRYSKTFTVPDSMTTGQASALASGSNLTIQLAMSGSYAPMQVRNVKLERGNKATDWTAAPEDVEGSITEASKTASNYITADSTGIKIHMSGSTSTYQHQSSTATTYYVNGNKRAEVGADGLKVYVGTTGTESSVAEFGTTARVGSASGPNVYVESGGVIVRDGTTGVVKFSGAAATGSYTRSSSVELAGWNGTALRMRGDLSTDNRYIGLESGFGSFLAVRHTDSVTEYGSFEGNDFVELEAEGMSVNGTTVDMDKQVLPAFLTQGGMVQQQSISATANAVTSHTVTFPIPYAASPIVTACFYSTSTAAAFGGLSLSVSAITTTSFTVKVFNNTSSDRSPGIFWIATPKTTLT